MKEFLEELKHDQEINKKEGIENRINIEYIIERLEDIEKDLENYLDDKINLFDSLLNYSIRDDNDKAIYEYSIRKHDLEEVKNYINGRF